MNNYLNNFEINLNKRKESAKTFLKDKLNETELKYWLARDDVVLKLDWLRSTEFCDISDVFDNALLMNLKTW